jgi:hypothetical protein
MSDIVERLATARNMIELERAAADAIDEIERLNNVLRLALDEKAQVIMEIEWLRHQIHFIQDMILRHKAEQTADPRCMCSEMDANLWAWAEDREGDLPVRQSNDPAT